MYYERCDSCAATKCPIKIEFTSRRSSPRVAARVHFHHITTTICCNEYFFSSLTCFPRLRCCYLECRQVIFGPFAPDSPYPFPNTIGSAGRSRCPAEMASNAILIFHLVYWKEEGLLEVCVHLLDLFLLIHVNRIEVFHRPLLL